MKTRANNTTGCVGVSFDSTNKKYKAMFYFAGDRIPCGSCDTLELAEQKLNEIKNIFANSNNKLLTYLQYKLPGVPEELLKEYIISALKEYVNSTSNCMFYGFCKNYILTEYHKNRMPKNGDLTWDIFEKKMNNISKMIVLEGKSIKQVRDATCATYEYVINTLKKLVE